MDLDAFYSVVSGINFTLLGLWWVAIKERGITLIGVSLGGLDDNAAQLALPLDVTSGSELDDVVDAVRDKYGSSSLRRAVQLGKHEFAVGEGRVAQERHSPHRR